MPRYGIIITRSGDEHSRLVCKKLTDLGITPIEIFRDRIAEYRFEFLRQSLLLKTPSGFFDAREACAVFIRTVPTLSDFGPVADGESASVESYIALQRSTLFSDWLAALSHCVPFVNDVHAVAKVMNKGAQQLIASRVGMPTAETYIGETSQMAQTFASEIWSKNQEICTKPISNKTVLINGQKHTRFTEKLSQDHQAELQHLDGCPVIIQRYIDKAYELRVTVVGDDIHACKISSQSAGGNTSVDWRRYNIPKTPHEKYDMPDDLNWKIKEFHSVARLTYSAFDFIKTKDGSYVFLETNPYGQWLWIEHLTGLKITESVARVLSNARS